MISKKIVLLKVSYVSVLFSSLTSCYNGPEENCVFIGEKANLHKEYYATVLDVDDYDTIKIIRYENETTQSELIGASTHYIGVRVLIEHQMFNNPKENHLLDLDDFKLKDHTGVQLGNTILFSNENGLALENKNFSTKKPVADYTWLNKEIVSGERFETTLFFEFSKTYSVYDTIMVLEFDFFAGRLDGAAGTDIVLAYRKQ